MGEDGARGQDWRRARGASPVSDRHNFLVLYRFYGVVFWQNQMSPHRLETVKALFKCV